MTASEVQQQRLFVGGLYEGATEHDIKTRLGRFGTIDSVDIKVKRDNEGKVFKTFAYVNITSDEKKIQRCMTTYNKTKWNGLELSIQTAKEDFLKRLKQEKEDVTEASQEEAAVISPAMEVVKSAKPGTLIEDKRNWVVGKYGQVLPIVYIRKKDKKKVMKHDPSKFTHAYKRINDDKNPSTVEEMSVSDLTWNLDVTETENQKKRKGIFPAYSPKKKKTLTKEALAFKQLLEESGSVDVVGKKLTERQNAEDDGNDSAGSADTDEILIRSKGKDEKSDKRKGSVDSKGEDSSLTEKVRTMKGVDKFASESDEDEEIQTDDKTENGIGSDDEVESEEDDSFDNGDSESEVESEDGSEDESEDEGEDESEDENESKQKRSVNSTKNNESEDDESESEDDESESEDGNISETRNSVNSMTKILNVDGNVSDDESESTSEEEVEKTTKRTKKITQQTISNGSNSKEEKVNKLQKSDKFPSQSIERTRILSQNDGRLSSESKKRDNLSSDEDEDDIFDMIKSGKVGRLLNSVSSEDKTVQGVNARNTAKGLDMSRFYSSSDSEDGEMDAETKKQTGKSPVLKNDLSKFNSSSDSETENNVSKSIKSEIKGNSEKTEEKESDKVAEKEKKKKKEKKKDSVKHLKQEKHDKSEQMRLESFLHRQKEVETQKNAIKSALANVDKSRSSNKIVFNSDSESSDGGEEKDESQTKGPSLFESDSDEEEDVNMEVFESKPQYEGKKGQKLMKMQSRFKGDDRFKLDQRFADSDSSEEDMQEDENDALADDTVDERTRSLDILQSIVGGKSVHTSRPVKLIKDVNALHYDPTVEAHQQFEIAKQQEEKTNAKPKKTKKNKGLQKEEDVQVEEDQLPEVSKDRFFKMESNLRAKFETEEEQGGGTAGGFSMLSLFGKTPEQDPQGTTEEATSIIPTVFPWQEPADHHDDSSDGENKQDDKGMEQKSKDGASSERTGPTTFFFAPDDPRLAESVAFFHRTEDLEVLREKWAEKRPALVDSYRLKRKRFLRKNRSTPKKVAQFKRPLRK